MFLERVFVENFVERCGKMWKTFSSVSRSKPYIWYTKTYIALTYVRVQIIIFQEVDVYGENYTDQRKNRRKGE